MECKHCNGTGTTNWCVNGTFVDCPYCGGRAGLWQAYDSSWCVQCDRCGASTMKFDKEEAVKRWNRRVKTE